MHTLQRLQLPDDIPGQIEAWQLKLDLRMPFQDADWILLSKSERDHVMRFHLHADQVRSVASRALLRKLLAEKTGMRPEALRFEINDYGKPALQDHDRIEFNVSHSGDFAMIAISTSGSVGVDIERYDRRIDVKSLGEFVFTPAERKIPLKTTEAFINHWVMKESVLKALGVGIADHLQSISIVPTDTEHCHIVHASPQWKSLRVWRIPAPHGYAAALAILNTAIDMVKS
ncbi:MAG: 4'-phosphopantetheinyl transferase family protein [Nitrosomonas sp.]